MTQQEQVGRWGEETFPHSTPATIFAHLRREVDELGEAIAAGEAERIQEEAADCQLLLYHLAHRHGFYLHDAAGVKFARVKLRTWGEPDAEGVVEHVR